MSEQHDRLIIGRLGALLLDGGTSATDVRSSLLRLFDRRTNAPVNISVLPSNIIVSDAATGAATMVEAEGADLTLVQAAQAHRLVRALQRGTASLGDVPELIDRVRAHPVTHPSARWSTGSAMIAGGLAVLMRCPWWAVVVAIVMGALVGWVTVLVKRLPGSVTVLPFLVALLSTLGVGAVTAWLGYPSVPLFGICAPIAILVPGAMITNALLELTSVDIVTGTSRLAYGVIMLAFMTAGIAASAWATGLQIDGDSAFLVGHSLSIGSAGTGWQALPPTWIAWVGVVVLALGVAMAFGANTRLSTITVLVMVCTYAILVFAGPVTGDVVATGIAGATLFLLSRLAGRFEFSAPAASYFQPAFLLLVPGTVGLVAIASVSTDAIVTALSTFISLCIGTKVGAIIADSIPHRPSPDRPSSPPSASQQRP